MRFPSAFVAIGRILKTHGVRGEVRVEPFAPDPERFRSLGAVLVTADGVARKELRVVGCREVAGGVLLAFEGIDSPEAAASLRGQTLEIPRAEAREVPPGEVLFADMIGLSAIDASTGAIIGTIRAIVTAGNDLLEIETPAGEVLVPWVPELVDRPDLDRGTVAIRPIPGLLEA